MTTRRWLGAWLAVLVVGGTGGCAMTPTADERTRPARLQPGDTIALIAPSRPPRMEHVALAADALRDRGYRVVVPDGLADRTGYLAGDDALRADELTAAFADPEIDAVFPITGGFGATRMIDAIDYDVIRRHPKVFIGFSDITALHAAIGQRAGLVTFHSPNPQWGLGSTDGMHPFAQRWFWRAIEGPTGDDAEPHIVAGGTIAAPTGNASGGACGSGSGGGGGGGGYTIDAGDHAHAPREGEAVTEAVTLVGGVAEGPIVGGNLSLVVALVGTPSQIDMDGAILFLEDVGEDPYRVDRMLRQLESAGMLDRLAGALLGRFTRAEPDEHGGKTIDDVLADYFADAAFPVVAHFPAGHVRDNATLPLGVPARLDADARSITFLTEPTRPRD
jgi:muramoyltetrapeptide carboxypeptidase